MADAYGTATGDASVSADAYNIHGLKENREFAVRKWGSRLRILLALQLITSLTLVFNRYWFANFVGVVGTCMGIYGTWKERRDSIFTYIIMTVLEFTKNIGLLYTLLHDDNQGTGEKLGIALAFVEQFLICPLGVFFGVMYHRALGEEDSFLRSNA